MRIFFSSCRSLSSAILFMVLISCMGQVGQTKPTDPDHWYSYIKGAPDGIGKWYMGREIANVMGFQGMAWLERANRDKEENTAKLLRNMDIGATDIIADIGAGSGYHVFKMAAIAKEGQIYAVDIQDEMLAALENKKQGDNHNNVTILKGSEKSVNLPEDSVDKVLMVDVYHELNFPIAMMASVVNAMRPDGKLYLIEYRGEDTSVPIKALHKMSEAEAIGEMNAAGLKLETNITNLPWQHCMIFVKQ